MISVFTICSNNYLAQAKTLGDSLVKHNPGYKYEIFLVDRLADEIDYSIFNPFNIIPVEQLGIAGFDQMFERYNITELNTAVKPFIFNYLFSRDASLNAVVYLDPDIVVYERFREIEENLQENNIILTPHFFTPIYDHYLLDEPSILNAGLYNLGFIAVKKSAESQKFLDWWMIKLKDQCYIDFRNGLFVDQLWINFVPIYFEGVYILRHLGYNVAYWNFHERTVQQVSGKYMVNNQFPLIFFHYSGYNFDKPEVISRHQTRYTFAQRNDLVPLFSNYHNSVLANRLKQYDQVPCYYVLLKEKADAAKQIQSVPVKKSLYYHGKQFLKKVLFRLTLVVDRL